MTHVHCTKTKASTLQDKHNIQIELKTQHTNRTTNKTYK